MTTPSGRGSRSPAPPRAGGAPSLLLALVALLLVGCGGPGEEAPPAEATPEQAGEASPPEDETDQEDAVRLAQLGDFRSAPGAASRFSHDPHGLIDCVACHADPPGHGTHASVRCSACHATTGAGDRRPSPAECMACHHDPERDDPCSRCHEAAPELPSATAVRVLRVAEASRERALPFAHDLHASVDCGSCHGTEGGDIARVECVACHDRHHTPDAACASCHAEPPAGVHATYEHKGCLDAGCHTDPTLPERPETRDACLSCHRAQIDHEPGRPCAPCHQLTDLPGGPS